MKVQATDVSKRYKLKIKELGRIANPGEVFEVTRDRFVVLNGANQFKSVFVVRYTEPEKEVEKEQLPESKEQPGDPEVKPKKRGRKKKESLDGSKDKK